MQATDSAGNVIATLANYGIHAEELGFSNDDAREVEHFPVGVDADGGPGNLVLGEQDGQLLGDLATDVFQMGHAATLDPPASRRFVQSDE